MSVKVTFEFANAEEAIVALGKLAGIKTRKNANAAVEVGTKGSEVGSDAAGAQAGVTDPGKTGEKPADPTSTVPPAAPAPRTRKPRADKGQTREPYGPRNTEANGAGTGATASSANAAGVPAGSGVAGAAASDPVAVGGSPAVQTAAAPAPAAPQATPPAPVAAPTDNEVQAAVEKLFNAKGFDNCLALLSRFGVKRGKDLPLDQRANFIRRVDGVIAGEAI